MLPRCSRLELVRGLHQHRIQLLSCSPRLSTRSLKLNSLSWTLHYPSNIITPALLSTIRTLTHLADLYPQSSRSLISLQGRYPTYSTSATSPPVLWFLAEGEEIIRFSFDVGTVPFHIQCDQDTIRRVKRFDTPDNRNSAYREQRGVPFAVIYHPHLALSTILCYLKTLLQFPFKTQ